MPDNEKRIQKGHVIEDLLKGGNARQRAINCLLEGLEAERSFYDSGSKQTQCEPDYKTRVTAAEILLAYTDGKPLERKEIITHSTDSVEAVMERIKKSPELRKAMREVLDQTEKTVIQVDSARP